MVCTRAKFHKTYPEFEIGVKNDYVALQRTNFLGDTSDRMVTLCETNCYVS